MKYLRIEAVAAGVLFQDQRKPGNMQQLEVLAKRAFAKPIRTSGVRPEDRQVSTTGPTPQGLTVLRDLAIQRYDAGKPIGKGKGNPHRHCSTAATANDEHAFRIHIQPQFGVVDCDFDSLRSSLNADRILQPACTAISEWTANGNRSIVAVT